jgi:hypothetical protein
LRKQNLSVFYFHIDPLTGLHVLGKELKSKTPGLRYSNLVDGPNAPTVPKDVPRSLVAIRIGLCVSNPGLLNVQSI